MEGVRGLRWVSSTEVLAIRHRSGYLAEEEWPCAESVWFHESHGAIVRTLACVHALIGRL